MTVITDYFRYTEENTQKYGEKTIVLMQVGAFFEVYGYKESKNGEMKGSKIEEFGRIIEYKNTAPVIKNNRNNKNFKPVES